MRGPLDVISETWEGESSSGKNVITYALTIREVGGHGRSGGENMKKANDNQKNWYDWHAREQEFEVSSKVLVLLLTSMTKLKAQ